MVKVNLKGHSMTVSISKLSIALVTCHDIPRVVDFLMDVFRDKPLAKFSGLFEDPAAALFLRRFCVCLFRENVSTVAMTPEGQIAGVALNTIQGQERTYDFGENPKFKEVAEFIEKTGAQSEIYEKYSIEYYMRVVFLAIHPTYKNQGLGKRLLEKTKKLAVDFGLNVMRVDCCSLEAAQIAKKSGWKCLYEIDYEDYMVDDKQVFFPDDEKAAYGVYAKKISSCGSFNCSD